MKNDKYLKNAIDLFGDDLLIFTSSNLDDNLNNDFNKFDFNCDEFNDEFNDELLNVKKRRFTYKNNYLYLYENGYNSLSFIYDDSPFGKNISRGEWENIIPYYLKSSNPIAWENFCFKRLKFIEFEIAKLLNDKNSFKKIKKISDCKARVRKRVLSYINPYFITITFNDEYLSKDYKRYIREILKKNNIRYCLISDIGKNGRIHYHGFIDIPYFNEKDLLCFFKYNRVGTAIFNFLPLLKLGFCTCSAVENFESSLSYALKYSLKDEISHTVLSSRF